MSQIYQMQLHQGAQTGNLEVVSQELERGVAVDTRDPADDRTPLMVAVTSPQAGLDMVRLLLDHGADVNAVENQEDSTVLGLAVRYGSLAKVELLLEAGANIHYLRDGGYNALIDAMHSEAMIEKEPLLPLVELLLSYGASPAGESDYRESALSVASHIARFDVVERLLSAGADPELLQWDELMYAVALGSLAEVERLVANGADLRARDRWERTPYLISLQSGQLDKAKLLLDSGADLNEVGAFDQTALMCAVESEQVEVLSWLIEQGAELDARDQFGHTALMKAAEEGATECVRRLLEAGATASLTDATEESRRNSRAMMQEINRDCPELIDLSSLDLGSVDFDDLPGEPAIAKAANLEIVWLLVGAGEELSDMSDEMRAQLTDLETEGEIVCSHEEYASGKHRRYGTANPEVMDIAFWQAMVRSGATAYAARLAFNDNADLDEPIWCFHRFGKSITALPDGRLIEIGGEHEDYYDSDFCIYNDVFVHHGGGRFEILGYPEAVFPPTDFHSATLVGDDIYIIGSLGYPEARQDGETPVYALHYATMAIERVETTGDKPGWINRHKAVYRSGGSPQGEIVISGGDLWRIVSGQPDYTKNSGTYVLDIASLQWRRDKSP